MCSWFIPLAAPPYEYGPQIDAQTAESILKELREIKKTHQDTDKGNQ